MKRLAMTWPIIFLSIGGAPVLACTPNYKYVPPTLKAESARSHSIVVATITGFRLLPHPPAGEPPMTQRLATFHVLFVLKGSLKEGDVIQVLDEAHYCGMNFAGQYLDGGANGEPLITTSNAWVLFLSGGTPYKLWESPRSGPLNIFSTADMRQLFQGPSRQKSSLVQPNPSLERP